MGPGLDFVMTCEREWGCYAEIPGLSICQIVRREGMDTIFGSRCSWDGHHLWLEKKLVSPEFRFNASGRIESLRSRRIALQISNLMVARGGIEPPTRGFSIRCSTN